MGSSADADREGRKLFLGGLAYEANEDDLRTDFGRYGDLEDVQLPMGDMGKHKGFAFLTYRSPEDASYAAKEHHQREYKGREISAKIVVPRSERQGDVRPGDWDCPSCGASVFGSKSACFKCGEPKPRGGGGGGGGGGRGGYDDRRGGRDDRGRDYDRRDRRDDRDRDYDRRDRRDDRGDRGRDRSYDRRDDRGDRGDRGRDRSSDRRRSYSRGRD